MTSNFEMTGRRTRRRTKLVPEAALDFVRELKIQYFELENSNLTTSFNELKAHWVNGHLILRYIFLGKSH